MGCQNGKPQSSKNTQDRVRSKKSASAYDVQRAHIQISKRQKKKTLSTQSEFTMTLQQLQNIREGLVNMPIMPITSSNTDPMIEIKNKKIIQRHLSGQIISLHNSKLFQRRKTQLSLTSNQNSFNDSFSSNQQN